MVDRCRYLNQNTYSKAMDCEPVRLFADLFDRQLECTYQIVV